MSFFPATHNVVVYAGDDLSFDIEYVEGPAGSEVGKSMTGATFIASIAPAAGDDATTAFTVTADADQVSNPGKAAVALSSTNSALLTGTAYVWDLEVTWASGDVQTILKGAVSVTQGVSE